MAEQLQFWGMRAGPPPPKKRTVRPRQALYRAAPRIPQPRLLYPPEYLAYLEVRRRLFPRPDDLEGQA